MNAVSLREAERSEGFRSNLLAPFLAMTWDDIL